MFAQWRDKLLLRHTYSDNPGVNTSCRFDEALGLIWNKIKELDQYINEKEPWKITDKAQLKSVLQKAVDGLRQIGFELQPFLPDTAEKIQKQFSKEKIPILPPYFKRIYFSVPGAE